MHKVRRRVKMEQKIKKEKVLNQFEAFMIQAKLEYNDDRKFPKIEFKSLNEKQQKVYSLVKNQIENPAASLKALVQGYAGTGKSTVILAIRQLLEENNLKYKIFSFTGSSAFLIGGQTIHSGLRLSPFQMDAQPAQNVAAIRKELQNIQWYLFDEFSLLGARLFGYVSLRLQAVFQNNEVMGSQNCLMFGDHAQLPAIGDFSLYGNLANVTEDETALAGCYGYKSFDKAVVLDQAMRAKDDEFRDLLLRLRLAKLTDYDFELLKSREASRLSESDKTDFVKNGLFLFPTRAIVKRYNQFRLELCEEEIVEIETEYTKNAPKELSNTLKLAKNSPVILTSNVHIASGLYNGARGRVVRFGPDDENGVPECIFVKFDCYYGKKYGVFGEIPITRVKRPEFCPLSKVTWTAHQFPLELAYAITVHRSQGQTLSKVVVGLPDADSVRSSMFRRLSPSLIYTALSRVRRIQDICFTQTFTSDLVSAGRHLSSWQAEETRLIEMDLRIQQEDLADV